MTDTTPADNAAPAMSTGSAIRWAPLIALLLLANFSFMLLAPSLVPGYTSPDDAMKQTLVNLVLLAVGYYLVSSSGLVLSVDYTVWGWTHLILGILAAVSGLGLLAGSTAARVAGIVLAVISAILNLVFIAAYPIWSVIVITVDVIVIYAIVVHGRELKT